MCEICNGKSLEQARREMLERIAEYDYTKVGVECEQRGGRLRPCWTYSIGLWSFCHVPEVIAVGMHDQGPRIVDAYAQLARAGERFKHGTLLTRLAAGRAVLLQRVDRGKYRKWFAQAYHFYPDGKFPAYQLIWQHSSGAWPWDEGWSHCCEPQPVLTASGRPDVDPAILSKAG